MLEEFGNILEMNCDAFCVTTNGFVKKSGECVMGKGIAKAVQKLYPSIPKDLGAQITCNGNRVNLIYLNDTRSVLSFPVKPVKKICTSNNDFVSHMTFKIGDTIPGWACKADIDIIRQSAIELKTLVDMYPHWQRILIPRPGCGAGELNWSDVKPVLASILDDRFVSVTFP